MEVFVGVRVDVNVSVGVFVNVGVEVRVLVDVSVGVVVGVGGFGVLVWLKVIVGWGVFPIVTTGPSGGDAVRPKYKESIAKSLPKAGPATLVILIKTLPSLGANH